LLGPEVHAVVSDYDMPGENGIEFLERVRSTYPDLSFGLFTGQGDEDVASEAISAGVSDYLQKGTGTEQYAVLADRVGNLVEQRRTERRLAAHERRQRESEEYFERLLRITSDPTTTPEEKTDRLLELGCERLGVEKGHLLKIDEDRYGVLSVFGSDVEAGEIFDLSETFCRRTIESEEILDIHDTAEQGWADDPAYDRFGFAVYIGKRLVVESELFGTLCFAGDHPREPFTPDEKTFFDLLTRWFDQLLERKRRRALSETVFESAQDGLFVLDVTRDGRLLFRRVSPTYRELTGRETAAVGRRPVDEVVGNGVEADPEARCRECIDEASLVEFEAERSLGDRERRVRTRLAPVVESDEVIQVVGTTRVLNGTENGDETE
jgi:GAF domain-containing protein